MAKNKLLVLKGLPASGKSTYAIGLTKQGFIRTNKDDIRESLYGGNWKRKDEKQVVRVRNAIVRDALTHNKSVVVDDTNLNPVHIKNLEQIAEECNADFEVDDSFLDVPIEVLIKRDLKRTKSVGENVIRGMYSEFIKTPNEISYNPRLPSVVIIDIDGTLAHMNGRKPYEWDRVGEDDIDEGVAHIVDALKIIEYAKIFLFSGRDSVCREETEDWLERNDIEYDLLAMRPEGDIRKDTEVKSEMLQEHVVGKYNVLFVIDDRPQMCRMWRDEYGFRVLQVGDPYIDF